MPDMAVGHDQIVVADARLIARARRAVDGDMLADDVVVADDQKDFFAFELAVLRDAAQNSAGKHVAALRRW